MELAEIVNRALEAVGGSQADLALRLGLSGATISRWYGGKVTPDPWSCIALAEITGVPPDDVLRAAGHDPRRLAVVRTSPGPSRPPDPTRYVDLEELDPLRRELVEAIRTIGTPDRRRFGHSKTRSRGDRSAAPPRPRLPVAA